MLLPCEDILKNFIPAIRSSITKKLAKEYKFNQTDIAKNLGLTQAAVSKYITGKYSDEIKKIEKNPQIQKISNDLAVKIGEKNINNGEIARNICNACEHFSGANCLVRHLSAELLQGMKQKSNV